MTSHIKFHQKWQDSIISGTATIKDALTAITKSGSFMACATSVSGELVGIVTDSDVRRALLSGAGLSDSVAQWVQRNPITGADGQSSDELLEIAKLSDVREIPIVDSKGCLSDIFVLLMHQKQYPVTGGKEKILGLATGPALPNAMLLLAGGLGTRLRSVLKDKPKSLAQIGDRPIIQTIIQNGVRSGIRKFYISVNYMAEKIRNHLNDPVYEGIDIEIVEENDRLGTAGPISLIAAKIHRPLVVTNADVLTTLPIDLMVRQHDETKAEITCGVHRLETVIPYGVFDVIEDRILGISEKPRLVHLVSSGIYTISPNLCQKVPPNVFFDMPTLIQLAIDSGGRVTPFLIHEYWRDIGKPDDFHSANLEYGEFFGGL